MRKVFYIAGATVVSALFLLLVFMWGIVIRDCITDTAEETVIQRDTVYVYPELGDRSLLILSMMWVESNFNPESEGLNNDTGVLQITPVYVDEANRILGYDRYSIEDAWDIDMSLDMFDIVQSRHNPDNDFMSTVYYHNKSPRYKDKVIQAYNMFLSYESMRRVVNDRYQRYGDRD